MKTIFISLFTVIFAITSYAQSKEDIEPIYQFEVDDINGEKFDFSELEGKKIMIVNTASKCGFTPQFKELQELYDKYKDQNFIIIGFPSNDFMNQDPGTNEEILEFCTTNFGVEFPMMSKIKVTGKKKAKIYKYLTDKELNGYESSKVNWNFQKYLINEEGYLVKVIGTKTSPDDEEIINWIEGK
ncbi:MAG: glutathione peroxidase [Marinilabiliales bacterium]|nr:MAG: glutathione peroxidase [Marinilabiliales bacterium]